MSYLNEEVNRTEPSLSVSTPCTGSRDHSLMTFLCYGVITQQRYKDSSVKNIPRHRLNQTSVFKTEQCCKTFFYY